MTEAATSGSTAGAVVGPSEEAAPDRAAEARQKIAPAEFREALGQFATGVTVITALDNEGRLHGLTANAFSALSLSPPLVLACVNYEARCFPVIRRANELTIHILAGHQGDVAKGFAQKGGDRANVCGWTVNESGLPVLHDYAIALECRVRDIHPGGDHAILVSEVQRIHHSKNQSDPLLYYRGQLLTLPPC